MRKRHYVTQPLKRSRTKADVVGVRLLARVSYPCAALVTITLYGAVCVPAHLTAAETLPLTRDAPHGQRFRLAAGKPMPGDDVASSWCLRLRYTTGVTVNGNPFGGGLDSCGPKPAPRVSGSFIADCEHNILYLFGGVRRAVDGIEVVRADGRTARAYAAALPKHSGFSGHTFVTALTMVNYPATVRETSAGRPAIARLPSRRQLCAAAPGQPEPSTGAFGDFES